MYQPGGATLGSLVTFALIKPAPWERMSSSTNRWPESNEWVVMPFLMRLAQRIFQAWSEAMVVVWPYVHSVGTTPITGRGLLKR